MTEKETTTPTEAEARREQRKSKSNKVVNAVLIGILIGIALYSAVKNGFGFFTLFPLLLAYLAFRNGKQLRE